MKNDYFSKQGNKKSGIVLHKKKMFIYFEARGGAEREGDGIPSRLHTQHRA